MNFLYVKTKGSVSDLPDAIEELGHHVSRLENVIYDGTDLDANVSFNPIEEALNNTYFDFVITFLYHPYISNICENHHVIYLSIIYDSPLISIFHGSIYNKCNRIFVFDSAFYERLQAIDVSHSYYIPLGISIARPSALQITNSDNNKFSADISFVGSLYENNMYNDCSKLLPEPVLNEFNTYLMSNLCKWENTRPWPILSNEITDFFLRNASDLGSLKHFEMPPEMYLGIMLLSYKLGEMERITLLNMLNESFDLKLYTGSSSPHISSINNMGFVDYFSELGKVFSLSKINLNSTLPCIETGVPQRILEIMSYGGFVLTNYQKDLEDFCEIGKDLVTFSSIEECKEKATYYLNHESERIAIAQNGLNLVQNNYTYKNLITKMLALV